MLENVEIGRVYRNIKTQQLYRVESIGLHTELVEETVHYKPLYESKIKDFYRPLDDKTRGFKVKFEAIVESLK